MNHGDDDEPELRRGAARYDGLIMAAHPRIEQRPDVMMGESP